MLTSITSFVLKHFKIHHNKFDSLKLGIIGSLLVCLAYVLVVIDPIACIVKDQLSIREGSLLFSLFKKPPLDVYISVYVFNITNLSAFLSKQDKKLRVAEVGPYVYEEILEHQKYKFHDNGTLTYFPKRKVVFVPERSIGDPSVDVVIVPNIPLLGASSAAASYSFFAALALSTLTKTLNSEPVLNLTVDEFLWGYDDPLVKLASNVVPNIITFERFGMLDRMFDEGQNEVTINLPERKLYQEIIANNSTNDGFNITSDYEEVSDNTNKVELRDYSIQSWNQNAGLSYWGYDEKNENNKKNTVCNRLRGTYDGTIFPKNISKYDEYRVYRKAFCRTLPIKFDHEATLHGLDAYYFKLKDNAFDTEIDDPNSSCFCQANKCLKKGLGNITPCYYNIPTAVSYPHFYNSDPSLLESIDGLSPNESRHGSEIVLQPQLGVPMRVHSRIQLNLLVDKIKFNTRLKAFEDLVIPVAWLEISVEGLTFGLILLLHCLFHVLPYLQLGLVYLFCIGGVSLYALAALLFFNAQHNANKDAKFHPKKDIRYSAIYWFPRTPLKELEKQRGEEMKLYETV